MEKYLLVFGGSGFLGQEICKHAVSHHIPVVSISRSGNANVPEPLKHHSLITWVKSDIFSDTQWQEYASNAYAVVNLIGILIEKPLKNQTYDKYIVEANRILTRYFHLSPIRYIFMSANGGGPFLPKTYIQAKRMAEKDVTHYCNEYTIMRPGLVVGKKRPSSLINGLGIKTLALIPFARKYVAPVYPIHINHLAELVLLESKASGQRVLNYLQ